MPNEEAIITIESSAAIEQDTAVGTVVPTEAPIGPLVQLASGATHPQQSLIEFIRPRLAQCRRDVAELKQALEKAVKNRWNKAPIARAVGRERKNADYYKKVLGALEAGYIVMPLLDCAVFAVRIGGTFQWPSPETETGSNLIEGRMLRDLKTSAPPIGEGNYFSNRVVYQSRYWVKETKTASGSVERATCTTVRPSTLDPEIPFPLALCHPEMMDAAKHAMSLRIFDEIAVSPADAATPGPGSRKRDPVLIGRIRRPSSSGMFYKHPACFMIGWLVRPEEMLV